MRTRVVLSGILVWSLVGACGGGDDDDDDDIVDASMGIDRDPLLPDADPNAPDADPNAPDGATSCEDGLTLCGGECADLNTNHDHCGTCPNACDSDETCVLGTCTAGVGALVISELHAQEPAYFELYNGGATAIDLSAHQIQWNTDGGATGSLVLPSYSLGPDEFVVLYEGTGTDGDGVIFLGASVAWTTSAAVRLLAPGGLGLDFVRTGDSVVAPPTGTAWTGDNAQNPAALVDQSLVRNVYAPDTDSAVDWKLVATASPGSYCPRPGRCGDACFDFASDHDNCGDCGVTCGGTQICIDGDCASAFVELWISEYRRYSRPGVEIHNPTANPINMTGFRLDVVGPTNLAYTFPAYTIEPGAFVFVYMGNGEDDATTLFAGPSAAFADDVAISLYDDSFTALDFVRFGASATPAPAGTAWFGANVTPPSMAADSSARRNLQTFDTDGAADWILQSPSTPAFQCYPGLSLCSGACVNLADDPAQCGACGDPCAANETCASGVCSTSGGVVVSEIKNAGVESFELFNGTGAAVDLGGWSVEWVADSAGPGSYTIPTGFTLESGAFVTLSESSGTDTATVLFMAQSITWNTAIAVSLIDDASSGVDFVRTGDSVTMPPSGTAWTGANATNPSNSGSETLRRQVYAADTNAAADWTLSTFTQSAHCPSGQDVCGGECFDLDTDPGNCGACGNVCASGSLCFNGECVEDGALRLVPVSGTNGSSLGRLDAFVGNGWRIVTEFGADSTDVAVACRQLGFSGGTDTGALSSSPCAGCNGRMYSIGCAGSEVRLVECTNTQDTFLSSGVRASCTP